MSSRKFAYPHGSGYLSIGCRSPSPLHNRNAKGLVLTDAVKHDIDSVVSRSVVPRGVLAIHLDDFAKFIVAAVLVVGDHLHALIVARSSLWTFTARIQQTLWQTKNGEVQPISILGQHKIFLTTLRVTVPPGRV